MEVKAEQLNILLNAIKDIVRSNHCPEWVASRLTAAVKAAKEYRSSEPSPASSTSQYVVDETIRPFVVNEEVISNVQNDICLYKIVNILDPVGGITLYNLQILKGNKDNPPGMIVHNIPETLLQHIKR